MHPILFRAGGYTVFTFTVIGLLAFAAGAALAWRALAKRSVSRSTRLLVLVACAAGGFAGARGWWIVEHSTAAWRAGDGGFVWYGGLVGGAVAVTGMCRATRTPGRRTADALGPGLALGLAIGRLGCHLAGDGDWGTPTALPWGVAYLNGVAGWPYALDVRVHPAPLYESAGSLLLFALLRRASVAEHDGVLFGRYAAGAGTLRFVVELVRPNPVVSCSLTAAQLASIALVAIGVATARPRRPRGRHPTRGIDPRRVKS